MLKTKTRVKIGFVSILSLAAGVQASSIVADQVAADDTSQNTTFQVNVVESLSVSITTPKVHASGGINTFLRNAINLSVTSNNANGFTASMYTDGGTTSLAHSDSEVSDTLPTLTKSYLRSEFPANAWGYSLGDYSKADVNDTAVGDTSSGSETGVYKAMNTSSAPISVLKSTAAATGTQDIYFGAKADASKAAGTYSGTVMISVVTGNITDDNPQVPTNPVDPNEKPSTNTEDGENGSYYTSTSGYAGSATGATVRNTTSGGGESDTTATTTTTTTTEISSGYTLPKGVIEDTTSNINTGAPLATGLAVTAGVAAVSGIFFFILAKRKKDDEDEDEEEQM